MKKRLVPSKSYAEVNERKKQIARELGVIEKGKVSLPELDRRLINVPNIDSYLKRDSEIKERFKK